MSEISIEDPKERMRAVELGYDAMSYLNQRLIDIAELIGISEPPPNRLALITFIKKHFGSLTLAQIGDAFIRNAAGTLMFCKEGRNSVRKYEHYQSFDINFIGNVLAAYTETIREEAKFKKPEPGPLQIENKVPAEVNDKRLYLALLDHIRKNNRIPPIWAWTDVFRALLKSGRYNPSEEEVKELIRSTREKIRAQAAYRLSMSLITPADANAIIKDLDLLDLECQKEYVINYVSKFLKTNQ